jgi:hypothetical protein
MNRLKHIVVIFSAFAMGVGFSLTGSTTAKAILCLPSQCTTCSCCPVDGHLTYDGGVGQNCAHRCIPPGGCDPPT